MLINVFMCSLHEAEGRKDVIVPERERQEQFIAAIEKSSEAAGVTMLFVRRAAKAEFCRR